MTFGNGGPFVCSASLCERLVPDTSGNRNPVTAQTSHLQLPKTERNRQHAASGCLQVTHAATRERCSFQRGSAVVEKWALRSSVLPAQTCSGWAPAPPHPLGWGQLHTPPHTYPGPPVTPVLPSQLPRRLCRVWLSQNSSCRSAQKWPRESVQHMFPVPSPAGCPAFRSGRCTPSCTASPGRSLSGRRVISQR